MEDNQCVFSPSTIIGPTTHVQGGAGGRKSPQKITRRQEFCCSRLPRITVLKCKAVQIDEPLLKRMSGALLKTERLRSYNLVVYLSFCVYSVEEPTTWMRCVKNHSILQNKSDAVSARNHF